MFISKKEYKELHKTAGDIINTLYCYGLRLENLENKLENLDRQIKCAYWTMGTFLSREQVAEALAHME